MAKNSNSNSNRGRSRNNNPEGHNQYSSGSWLDSARDRPIATAATAAAAVGAGVFLWSRRSTISDQISNLSDQITDWKDNMRSSSSEDEYEMAGSGDIGATSGAATGASSSRTSRSTGSRPTSTRGGSKNSTRGMSETGSGNGSLGAHGGSTGPIS